MVSLLTTVKSLLRTKSSLPAILQPLKNPQIPMTNPPQTLMSLSPNILKTKLHPVLLPQLNEQQHVSASVVQNP
jgi:hypothetical protein